MRNDRLMKPYLLSYHARVKRKICEFIRKELKNDFPFVSPENNPVRKVPLLKLPLASNSHLLWKVAFVHPELPSSGTHHSHLHAHAGLSGKNLFAMTAKMSKLQLRAQRDRS